MKKYSPFFSVIVPVYKVESYLSKCIDSVLNQTFTDFELILVDDGSPDNCPHLCDYYASKDYRVKVIHKKNGGLADARNSGLAAMYNCGSNEVDYGYIIFIDSDDYFCDNNIFQLIYDRIKIYNEDMVLYGCKTIYNNGVEENSRGNYPINILNKHEKINSLNALYSSNNIPGSAWIFSIKRSIVRTNNLHFTKGVTAEDNEWIISCLVLSDTIGAVEGIHYAYVKREGSITTKARITSYWGLCAAFNRYYSYNKRYKTLDLFLAKIYILSVMTYNRLPKENKEEAYKILRKYISILYKAGKKKYYFFIKCMGFTLSSLVISFVYKIIR